MAFESLDTRLQRIRTNRPDDATLAKEAVEFEMLEGMANHQARVVKEAAGGLLLYAPVVGRDDFHSAIAYLVRRLDENTSEENFLHDLFGMTSGDAKWNAQRDRFLEQLERAMQTAVDARAAWQALGFDGRAALLRQADASIAAQRGHIIATMVLDAGKAASEGDVEVSEAIDFANYYADRFSDPAFFDGSDFTPLGTVVIAPPWNFPFAIPCGGVLAALIAGNTVILKPATALTGWVLAQFLWDAGIPREVLQFITCAGEVGRKLLTDDRTGAVVLTGGWDTARMFLDWKPDMRLFAA